MKRRPEPGGRFPLTTTERDVLERIADTDRPTRGLFRGLGRHSVVSSLTLRGYLEVAGGYLALTAKGRAAARERQEAGR